jgi:hypothetical protein
MEGVLFIIIVFGGGMLFLLSKSEIGRAIADRIRGRALEGGVDPALVEYVERLRLEVGELHERMEFTERLLAFVKTARTKEENDARSRGRGILPTLHPDASHPPAVDGVAAAGDRHDRAGFSPPAPWCSFMMRAIVGG